VISITKTNLGSANCYIVSNADNKYFLKEFQSNFESTDLLREAKLVNYLAAQSIPTARFIETVNGRFFFEYANHLICLKEYIDGTTYGYYNFPKEM
ncbi:MAG: hypothetical protein J6B39_05605, partial [Lachnospiraceae bacterium]|nr:hypothetical protein [Lachnospiraceae bacterium]